MITESKSPSNRGHVLVVDDEEQILLLLKTILSVYGFTAHECPHAWEAVAHAKELRPDVIILDVAMPDIDGYEVCRQLKAQPETASIPVVMITALALDQDKRMAIEAGADCFILKPFDPRHVISEIERLSGQHAGS